MNIIFKNKIKVPYETLDIGEVFHSNSKIYMVTDQPGPADNLLAVNLSDGEMSAFDKTTNVQRIECDLYVKEW